MIQEEPTETPAEEIKEELSEEGKAILKKSRVLGIIVFITWALTALMCAGAIVFSKYLTDAIAGFLLIIPAVNIVFIFTFLGYNKKHKNCYGEYIKEYDKKTFRSCIAFS